MNFKKPGKRKPVEAYESVDWEARIYHGLWPLVLFLALGVWARSGFAYLPSMPDGLKEFMGEPPPPVLVNGAFIFYLLSALVLSLTRMALKNTPGTGLQHVGYLAGFFLFYHLCGELQESYWALMIGGAVILIIEWYRNRLYCLGKLRDRM